MPATGSASGRVAWVEIDYRLRLARRAEECVEHYLRTRGFEIVATNLRLGHLEIDIVARRRELVLVVEVRTRSSRSWTTPHGSVLGPKRRRLRRAAARLWKERYCRDSTVQRLRIDVAAVHFDGDQVRIDYSAAAFS